MKNQILKKLCATITAICFLFAITGNNLYASINIEPVQSQKQYFDLKANSNLDTLFSSKYGKIISFNNNISDTVVINIQDLHCDYFVQKNISALIDELSKKYRIDEVFVEGGIGNIDTSFLSNINSQYKENLLDNLLKSGKLTGTEYYSAINGKTDLLKGAEDKDIYLENIIRLTDIINSKDEINIHLSKVNKEIEFLKFKYLNSKNKQFDNLLKQNENKEITQEQFITNLFNYAKNNNISLKNYKNLQIYLNLFAYSVNNKNTQEELLKILEKIKKTLPYEKYNQFVSYTSNFTDTQNLRLFVEKFCNENNIDLSKSYPNLNSFFYLQKQSLQCNPVELVKEERTLIDIIRSSLSDTQTELEISYISDFEQFYKGYLSASLTSSQWEYVKLGLRKFKEIYAKYSISNDVEKMDKYSKELNLFYDINNDRNNIFISKMNLNRKILKDINRDENISEILSKAKKILVLVAGGYHTDGINNILNNKGITNITITPNISKSTKQSRSEYEYLVQQQAMSIKQMIALGLMSNATAKEQILAIVGSLLENQKLDGININILVDQLNRIFDQNIKVSLINDSTQIEFSFSDDTKQVIDIDEDVAKIVSEQNKTDLSSSKLVQVTGDNLKEIANLVLETTFNIGEGVFAPQIYKISKDICVFMVNNKWYLGNGAVWEIANSEYNGQTLDGVEPVIYEYMPDFMQKALLSKQTGKDLAKKGNKSKKFLTKIGALLLTVALLFNLTGCKNNETPVIDRPVYTQTQVNEYIEEASSNIEVFEDPSYENRYLAYYVDEMSTEDKLEWHPYRPAGKTDEEILNSYSRQFNTISTLRNTYDQALVAVTYLKLGEEEKAGEILREIYKFYQYDNKIYKSNLEYYEILGEITWVGIAAVQYKLATGSTEFDELIEIVDNYIASRQSNYADFLYSSESTNFSTGAYVSTEHMLDVVSYLNLKSLLPGNEHNEFEKDLLLRVAKYIRTQLIKNDFTIKRGKDDYSTALDTYSWGIQVIFALQKYNPDIFTEAGFDTVNLSLLLQNAEELTHVTDEQLEEAVSVEEYERMSKYHLYSWSNFVFYDEANNTYHAYSDTNLIDPRLNISFEWSLQMATAYYLMGDYDMAETILDSAKQLSAELGFSEGLYPVSNLNYVYNYPDYGWLVARAPGVTPTVTAILLELALNTSNPELASPHFPVQNVEPPSVPSSILPSTTQKINELISSGEFSIQKAINVILNSETVKSLFNPLAFISDHSQTKGAEILTLITTIIFLFAFGIFLSQAVPWFLSLIASIVAALFANIGTHVIIDYRYLKSIGLNEAINLYGKENVRLTDKGVSIDGKNSFKQIYVINDKPKNIQNFNFKSVPIKVRTKSDKLVKCWIGNYNGTAVLFAEGANYETIVKEFSKTKKFESVYGGKTALKANVDIIEIDMNNPNAGLSYSDTGNIIIGANIIKTENHIDLEKEISLLNNKKVEAVTINQNIAIYVDDEIDTISSSQYFIELVKSYIKNENLGTNTKILFSNKYINRVLELLKQEQGSDELAQQKFIEIIKVLQDNNKEIVVVFEEGDMDFNKYQEYGIFSYVVGNEYVDGITSTKTQAKFVTNLSQISCFDGSLSIIKVSLFRKEIEQSSGLFTFLSSALNLKEYMKQRSKKFIKQVADNFDYNQIPQIDIDIIATILKSENKFDALKSYLNEKDSIYLYYLGLSNEEEKSTFIYAILERILVANYLRQYDNDNFSLGLKDKRMETILAASLVAKALASKDKENGIFDISSEIVLDDSIKAAQFEIEFETTIKNKVSSGFKENGLNKIIEPQTIDNIINDPQSIDDIINDTQSIDDIIKLIPLYAERNMQLRTANVDIMDIQNIKGILSAA